MGDIRGLTCGESDLWAKGAPGGRNSRYKGGGGSLAQLCHLSAMSQCPHSLLSLPLSCLQFA